MTKRRLYMREMAGKGWIINLINYAKPVWTFGKAKDCIACGQCEGVCPQYLPIIQALRQVFQRYDG